MKRQRTWKLLREKPWLWERYFIREKVITAIRRFFLDQGFHEIETPSLTGSLPPESYLDVFETELLSRTRKKTRAYLPTSPEPFLKKLLVAGVGNCFSITKSFRNTEDMSLTHNPEFTILEWYRTPADYTHIMKDCEDLILFIHTYLLRTKSEAKTKSLKNSGALYASSPASLVYQGNRVSIARPWERITIAEAYKTYAGIDEETLLSEPKLKKEASKRGYDMSETDTWEAAYNRIFLNEIEPRIGKPKPTIIYDYPVSQAALAKVKKTDKRWAERFEFYVAGLELGDAYSELTDWKEQLERFKEEEKERKRLGKVGHPVDYDFIEALKAGMPETGGIAVGVDRLIMLFADVKDIAETMFFPAGELFEAE